MRLFKLIFIIGLGLYGHIAIAGIAVVNGLTHEYNTETGQTYRGTIEIQNTGNASQTVKLYLTDYGYTASGEINYGLVDKSKHSNHSWIELNATYVELGPKEKQTIPYDIKVPDDSALKGSYWSLIIVEPVDKIQPTDAKATVKIRNVMRYAIQVITTVSNNEPKASLRFIDSKIKNSVDGKRLLEIDIENNGDLYHIVKVNAEFYDGKDGTEISIFKSEPLSVLPSNSKRFNIDITNIPLGYYKVIVLADCNDGNVFGLNLDLNITNN